MLRADLKIACLSEIVLTLQNKLIEIIKKTGRVILQ